MITILNVTFERQKQSYPTKAHMKELEKTVRMSLRELMYLKYFSRYSGIDIGDNWNFSTKNEVYRNFKF